MKTKNEYIDSLATELKEWSAKIDLLVANSENATAEIKLRIYTGSQCVTHQRACGH